MAQLRPERPDLPPSGMLDRAEHDFAHDVERCEDRKVGKDGGRRQSVVDAPVGKVEDPQVAIEVGVMRAKPYLALMSAMRRHQVEVEAWQR